VSQALKEVEAYSLFSPHPNIIHSIDHSVISDKSDAGSKTVYILLPYYRRGNLQDVINANLVNHTKWPERELMVLVKGLCKALKALHQYKVGRNGGLKGAKSVRMQAVNADMDAAEEVEEEAHRAERRKRRNNDMDTEQEPLMDDDVTASQVGVAPGQIRAYAHRDIKPGNIMLADDSITPILMDLGSLAPAPTPVTSRAQAIAVQEDAAEHCTMPYRAPELFDVQTDTTIDTKVDIWSVGCTIYACLTGKSPFEARSDETGGSLAMCILNGDWRFPQDVTGKRGTSKQSGDEADMSEGVKEVVRQCLQLEPNDRPDVDELLRLVEETIAQLPHDELS